MSQPTEAPPAGDGFARALYSRLASQDGNLAISPVSIESCVLLALAGAREQTAAQIAAAIQTQSRTPDEVGALLDRFQTLDRRPGAKADPAALVIANSVWVQSGFPIQASYRSLLEAHDRAKFETVDFAKQVDVARRAINTWVDDRTKHKIKELLAPGSLDSSSRMVLANAIYFKGQWARPFREQATTAQPFHRPGQAPFNVRMMHADAHFRYLETDSYQAIELPYVQGDLAMVIWLPTRADELAAVERELSGASLAGSLEKLASASVDLYLPKFKIESSLALRPTLVALGMQDAFSPKADFSGISSEPLWISAVVHQALVDVNEAGTEAAPATAAIAVGAAALPVREEKKIFRADHPFIFAIRNRTTQDVLFLGRVASPGK